VVLLRTFFSAHQFHWGWIPQYKLKYDVKPNVGIQARDPAR